MRRDSFSIVHRDELERAGGWRLVRRSLHCWAFGANLVEIAPGESIPEHDETERDQEELFFVVSGEPTLVIDGEDHRVPAGTFARLDPDHRRAVAQHRRTVCVGVDRVRPGEQRLSADGLGMSVAQARQDHPLGAVIERYNDAWNRHDVDAIVALHAPTWCSRPHRGRARRG